MDLKEWVTCHRRISDAIYGSTKNGITGVASEQIKSMAGSKGGAQIEGLI